MSEKLKILHLEDLKSDAELVDMVLKKGGIEFDKVLVDAKDHFVHALEDFRPDIILSDHSLPSFNSLEALKIVQSKELSTPFILITATISEEFAVTMMQSGATDYILKDRLQRLPAAVRNAVEKHRLSKERQKFIEDVIANEALMKDAEHLAHFGSWQYVIDTRSMSFSEEMYAILGYDPGEMIPDQTSFLEKVYPADKDLLRNMIKDVFSGKQKKYDLIFRIVDKNKEIKYLRSEVLIFKNEQGSITKITGFCQDITDIKKKEEELVNTSNTLRELASHLQHIREEERASIAREIHDALGQQITALKIDISWLLKRTDISDPAVKNKADQIMEMLASTINMVRKISTQLRPAILDDLGLKEALRWQGGEFEKRTGIKVSFSSSEILPDTKNIAIALFRIYQESLTNVARHAEATVIDTRLEYNNNILSLIVHDNGKGFDPQTIKSKKTLGLIGMKERTLMIGGEYNVSSTPGSGTTVTVTVGIQ